jgi:hypothetical protein
MIVFIGYDAAGTPAPVYALFIVNGERVEVPIGDTATIAAYNTLIAIQTGAETAVLSIPNWAHWTEAETLSYIDTNVVDLASAKIVLRAMARLLIALRNETWPNLQET